MSFKPARQPSASTSRDNEHSRSCNVTADSCGNMTACQTRSCMLVVGEGCPLLKLPSKWLFASCSGFKCAPPACVSHASSKDANVWACRCCNCMSNRHLVSFMLLIPSTELHWQPSVIHALSISRGLPHPLQFGSAYGNPPMISAGFLTVQTQSQYTTNLEIPDAPSRAREAIPTSP